MVRPTTTHLICGLACMVLFRAPAADAQLPLNLDFETPAVAGPDRPRGWWEGWSPFAAGITAETQLDSVASHSGRFAFRVTHDPPDDSANANQSYVLRMFVPAHVAIGKDVRLTGWIRTEALQGGARVALTAWGDSATSADSAPRQSAFGTSGTTPWTQHEMEVSVDSSNHSVIIALETTGTGTAWFDDLRLFVDGHQIDTIPPDVSLPTATDIAWLARHSAPLDRLEPTGANEPIAFEDLAPVGDIVGDARIVALGESTHGTKEFFRMKHRLTEYLVRELGFTVFAIEANQLGVEQVNQYVQHGIGTARQAMRTMFQVWNTESMLDFVEWIRSYNVEHPDKVIEFIGYDMQDHKLPIDSILAFLEVTEPSLRPTADSLYRDYAQAPSTYMPQLPDSVREHWRKNAETMWSILSDRQQGWLAAARTRRDTSDVQWAVQNANVVRQAAINNHTLSVAERDSFMAVNLDWQIDRRPPGTRTIVWAHDTHVSRGGDAKTSFYGGATLGAYLSRRYGDALRVFGLETHRGRYTATATLTDRRIVTAEATPAPLGSVEDALYRVARQLDAEIIVADLRPARTDTRGSWLMQPRPIRSIGYAAYDYGFEQKTIAPREFDALIYIEETRGSRLLR